MIFCQALSLTAPLSLSLIKEFGSVSLSPNPYTTLQPTEQRNWEKTEKGKFGSNLQFGYSSYRRIMPLPPLSLYPSDLRGIVWRSKGFRRSTVIVSLWKIMAMDQGNLDFQIRGSLEDHDNYGFMNFRLGYAWIDYKS